MSACSDAQVRAVTNSSSGIGNVEGVFQLHQKLKRVDRREPGIIKIFRRI